MQKTLRICNIPQNLAFLQQCRCCGRRMDMQGSTRTDASGRGGSPLGRPPIRVSSSDLC